MRAHLFFVLSLSACSSPAPFAGDASMDGDASDVDAAPPCKDPGTTGCACAPVASGAGGTLQPSGSITKLVADSTRCRLYGLAGDRIVVIDTRAKTELAPITLASTGNDLDLAVDGATLVITHRDGRTLTVIDPVQGAVTKVLPLPVEPGPVEVAASGIAFYTTHDQFTYVHRIDLTTGVDTIPMALSVGYQVELELSAEDDRLYVGESAVAGDLDVYDVAGGAFTRVARTRWNNGSGFAPPSRHLLVSRTGNAYYAGHQWLAHDMTRVTGSTIEDILVENDAGTVAIGTQHGWDVALSIPTITHPTPVTTAAFTASGQEAWMATASGLRYVATSELAGSQLGVRERTPASLSSYRFHRAVFDPARNVIYASDSARHSVVVIDPVTLNLLREIVVGGEPTDLAIDRAGAVLYAGHQEMDSIGVVDLDTRTFVRFAHTPRLPYALVAAGPGRVIVADKTYDSAPTLFDVASENAAPTTRLIDAAALAVSADGLTLFAGSTRSSAADIFRFTITSSGLALTATTTLAYSSAVRRLVLHPNGARLMFAYQSISTLDLTMAHYTTLHETLAISPDGRVAVTGSHILDAATGIVIGTLLSSSTSAQVISPDSQTLFLFTPNLIERVPLAQYQL